MPLVTRGPCRIGRLARLLARRQRGDVRGRRLPDSAFRRRDRDAAGPGGGRRRRRTCSGAHNPPRGRCSPAPPPSRLQLEAGSSGCASRTTGSRTTCRSPPICSCSVAPVEATGAAFDDTAARASARSRLVHRLLTETEDLVDGGTLIRSITASAPVSVSRRGRSPSPSTPPRRRRSASSPTSW